MSGIENAAASARSDHQKQGDSLVQPLKTRAIDQIIKQLLPTPIRRADLLALFEHRATFPAIQQWRYGHNGAPKWVYDLLQRHLENKAASILAPLRSVKIGRGQGWDKGANVLKAWRVSRAQRS